MVISVVTVLKVEEAAAVLATTVDRRVTASRTAPMRRSSSAVIAMVMVTCQR